MFNQFKEILTFINKKENENKYMLKIVEVAYLIYILNKNYTLEEQSFFYKNLYTNYMNASQKEPDLFIATIFEILSKYYKESGLLYFNIKTNNIYIFFDHTKIYKFNNNSWNYIILDEYDDIIKKYNSIEIKQINNNMYGFITTSAAKNPRIKYIISYDNYNYNNLQNTLIRLNSYIKKQDDLNNLVFKYNYKKDEIKKNNFDGNISKKTFKSGRSCINDISQANVIFNYIKNEIYFKDKIQYYANNTKYFINNNFLFNYINNYNLCDKIAILLIILDIIEYQNFRWFLSPYELEFYSPLLSKKNN